MVDFLLQCHTTSTPPENAQATQKNEKHPGCGACFRNGVGTLAHLNMKKDGFIPVLSLCLSVFLWRKYLNSFWFVKSEFLEHVFYHQHKWCFLSTVCNVTTFLTCLWPILETLQKNTLADGYYKATVYNVAVAATTPLINYCMGFYYPIQNGDYR